MSVPALRPLAAILISALLAQICIAQAPAVKGGSPRPASGSVPRTNPARKDAQTEARHLSEGIHSAIDGAVKKLQSDGDFEAATRTLSSLFDQTIARADPQDKSLFVDAAFALRLARLLESADKSTRRDTLTFLLDNPDLARALAFIVQPGQDKPVDVLAMLDRLRERHSETLNQYANLAAAICVVHDQPFEQRINENRPSAPDPVLLYGFFVANEKKTLFGIREMPAELLVHVVDCCASIDEMQWALKKYAGDDNIGARFFDVKYDFDYLQKGSKKKVDAYGWNLPNILKYGGICADQAYFATTIGKCIGVPTAYTTGASAEAGHAWVGFVQADRTHAWWNFNAGRYEEYKGVRGSVIDPQTRRPIPDSYVSLLADFVGAKTLDRYAAVALTDAAQRLIEQSSKDDSIFEAVEATGDVTAASRAATTQNALELLEAGLKSCPGYATGWFTLRKLAEDGKLSLEDKKRWGGVLHRLCGERYPDFYLAIVKPMIETIDEVDEQNALWNAAFKVFAARFDLAAAVRMEQADMWLSAGAPAKAGQCCEDVIARYANAGPFVIDALRKAEKILKASDDPRRVLALYRQAWSRIDKPRDMAGVFVMQSNWYRVGKMYAERLNDAGQSDDAAQVRAALGMK